MRKVLLDTNIIIDLLAKREPFDQDARKLFSFADKEKVSLFTSALSIANVSYVLLRKRKPEEAKQILRMAPGRYSLFSPLQRRGFSSAAFSGLEDLQGNNP